jgi:uncharacterized protein (TIGR00251 family)
VSGIRVRVTPRAKRNEIAGWRDGVLQVRVAAPPVEGRANDAVCKLLAKRLRVPRSSVQVVRGESARDKLINIEQLTEEDLKRALGP